jgi:hypothetical protein
MKTQDFEDAVIHGENAAETSGENTTTTAAPPATAGNGGTAPAPPPGHKLIDPFDLYLQREPGEIGFLLDAEFINFNGQTGEWSIGRSSNKKTISPTVPFLCNMSGMAIGWTKIVDNKVVDRRIGLVVDGYQRVDRSELDDYPEHTWPFYNGKRQDPWKLTTYLPMRNAEDDELVVYGPFAPTQLKAIKAFVALVRRSNREGRDPVVLLGNRDFTNQSGGTTYVPVFKIVDWQYWDGQPPLPVQLVAVPIAPPAKPGAKALPKRGELGDMDDEIPF